MAKTKIDDIGEYLRKNCIRNPINGCLEYTGSKTDFGYGRIKYNGRTYRAHRLAYALANNIDLDEIELNVLHNCDNPACIDPSHLRIGTHLDNMIDMSNRGRRRSGDQCLENNGAAKLTNGDVIRIWDMINSGMDNTEIALLFGVNHSTISSIKIGRTWSKIDVLRYASSEAARLSSE